MDRSDAELIRAAKTSPEALGELFRRHAPKLERWLSAQVPFAVAAELTAETFAQAALHLGRFRDEAEGSAGPWLFGIAKNLLSRYRHDEALESKARRRLHIELSGIDELEEADRRMANEPLAEALRESLAALEPGHREALELRVVSELEYREIAKRLGCSEVAARLRVMRALSSLQRALNRGGA